ncbi:AmmeMemoRadiSam system protein B [Variovorax sp. J22P240]|uniref:AmmeMemoRadiSam system protein B n=1 Tax=Variovorax sp. J22P240 TaxID=3053514 RepID=UPI002577F532|nr:AmmeMemoRadiSam system protein B [Variovorax sp. J22P240]MDL9998894.1 AmmeMemoRadiSam system protein B [Variovorax sp. J22P240]
MPAVRHAAVDGLFYPAAPDALREEVANCLDGVVVEDPARRRPKLIISPHAGYEYCGAVAAHAYALLARRREPVVRRVVLFGPAHREWVSGLAAPDAQSFETPLGRVPVDLAALASLGDLPQVVRSDRAHEREHSLEVQLPFLQSVLGHFTLVPLVVGNASVEAVAQVLERLWGGPETLIVISSDLSHYLPYEKARAIDRATVQRILGFDAGLSPHEACGSAAINGALRAARHHGLAPRLLDLRNSGDTAGDRDRVVGYGAIAFEETP